MIGNPLMLGSADYQITRSLRFRSSASAYLNRTPASAGSRTAWSMSMWVKRGALSTGGLFSTINSGAVNTTVGFNSDSIDFLEYQNATVARLTTTAKYRDPSAWYHVVVVWDSSNGTSADRIRIYVNGTRITDLSTATYPSSGLTSTWNNNVNSSIGTYNNGSPPQLYFDGYMAEVNFIDGQALTPSSFGETDSVTGVWLPKKFTGTYGTNGFYLPFTDNSGATSTTIGKDYSVNGNNWTPNNISVTAGETYDSMTDVPTLTSPTAANYCVLNPLSRFSTGGTLSNGNLTCALSSSTGNNKPTIGAPSGKWYAEFTISSLSGQSVDLSLVAASPDARSAKLRADYCSNGQTYNYGTSSYVSYGAGWAANDVIGVAWDLDANQVTFYRNGTSQGTLSTPSLGTNASGGDVSFTINNSSSQSVTFSVNFGQRPFAYTPPSGFVALNTFNLPTPAISAGNKHMNATLYTGNGSTQSIVNSGSMQPDFVWVKDRSVAYNHILANTVAGITNFLNSNTTNAESGTAGLITAVNSNGFSVGSVANVNANTDAYVGWQWKAGGTAVTNTSGSITSTVSANTTSGFSVVTYTGNGTSGASVGHGLGATPSMYIIKARGATTDWMVYHISLGNNVLFFNTNAAATANSAYFSSYPNSTAFYLSTDGTVNTSTTTYVAYCFAPIAGFSAFGSYTGNGSTDGSFIYTGFRPRWILQKRTTGVGEWRMWDTSRQTFNVVGNTFNANTSDAEYSGTYIDILSNGFKLRATSVELNGSGDTYIYAAFAENPFKYSLAR